MITEEKRQVNNYTLAVATSLAVFCMGQIPGSIDAAISKISIAFNLSSTTGMYVTTVACIVSVLFSILLGFIAGKRIGYRPLVLFCATVELISALVPFFTDNFVMLIVLRGIFGIGFGGMQSMENTVATVLIPVEKRASILGMGMFVGFGMNCILQFLGGILADFGWNHVFLNHILLLIPYCIVLVGCMKMNFRPTDTVESAAENTEEAKSRTEQNDSRITRPIVQCWILMLFVGIFIAPLLVGCSFLSEAIVESATVAGIVAVFFSVGCMIGGLCYAKIFDLLGKWTLPLFLLLMAAGIAGSGIARNIPLLCVTIFLAGMGFSLTQANAMMILGLSSPGVVALASALMMALFNLGMFLSSSFEELIGTVTGDSLYTPLFIGAAVLALFAVVYSIRSPLKE